ncbi:O-antigen ligase family protein [Dactylosporangium sp. CA-092794]|uniref:O-antigen ligase family protein n=1 Tax=Dactylosporangium sp. CA-092794 TaxID=3239929 RepID=UPI003D8F9206
MTAPRSHRRPGGDFGPLFWVRAVVALGLTVPLAIWSPSYYITLAAAVALPVVAGRYALATVAFFAITAREAPSGRGFDYVTMLGSRIFYEGKAPAIDFLAASAIVVALIRLYRRGDRLVLRRVAWWLLGCLAALAALAFVLGIVYGQSVFSAANQNSRNFVVAAMAVVIGLLVMEFPEEIKAVKIAALSGLGILVIAAAYAVATGQAADERVSRYFTYYDSALPAVATAVFGALLISRSRLLWPAALAMGLSLVLLLIGFRLTIWLATLIVLAFSVLLSREWKAIVRRSALSAVVLAVCILVLPGMRSDITNRVIGASSAAPAASKPTPTPDTRGGASRTETAGASPTRPASTPTKGAATPRATPKPGGKQGGGQDVAAESSQGHLEDIRVAWSYVRVNFWTGIGPQHPQLPGLASDKTTVLYVHNEFLQDWLRFGPGAVLLVTAFLLIIAVLAIRSLAGRKASTMHRGAAILGLITPICLLAFPYFSESHQWPFLVGGAAGILAAGVKISPAKPEDEPSDAPVLAPPESPSPVAPPSPAAPHELDTVVFPAVRDDASWLSDSSTQEFVAPASQPSAPPAPVSLPSPPPAPVSLPSPPPAPVSLPSPPPVAPSSLPSAPPAPVSLPSVPAVPAGLGSDDDTVVMPADPAAWLPRQRAHRAEPGADDDTVVTAAADLLGIRPAADAGGSDGQHR